MLVVEVDEETESVMFDVSVIVNVLVRMEETRTVTSLVCVTVRVSILGAIIVLVIETVTLSVVIVFKSTVVTVI